MKQNPNNVEGYLHTDTETYQPYDSNINTVKGSHYVKILCKNLCVAFEEKKIKQMHDITMKILKIWFLPNLIS